MIKLPRDLKRKKRSGGRLQAESECKVIRARIDINNKTTLLLCTYENILSLNLDPILFQRIYLNCKWNKLYKNTDIEH